MNLTSVPFPSWQAALWHDITQPIEVEKRSDPRLGNERFIISGGLGSAKTTGCLRLLFMWMLYNRNCPEWWCIAPTHARHEDAIIPSSVFVLKELLGLRPDIDFKVYYGKPQKITLFTNQVLHYYSGDRPERLTSATIGGYLITEPGQMKRMVYEKVEDRTRSKLVHRTLGLIEGTPEGDNWYMDEFNINKLDPARKLRRFTLHTEDNVHNLASGYVERLKRMYSYSKAKTAAYLYGEFMPFNVGNVYAQFADHRNVIDNIEASPLRKIIICMDFNATPLTWTAWQIIPYEKNGRRVMREICIAESSLDCTNLLDAAVEFGVFFSPDKYRGTEIEIWGDRTGHARSHKAAGTDFSNFKKYLDEQFHNVSIAAKKQVTPIRGSVDVTNRLFLYELLLVCARCKNLRRSYNNTTWADGKADIKKTQGETHTHHGDGPRYRHFWMYKDFDPEEGARQKETIIGANPA